MVPALCQQWEVTARHKDLEDLPQRLATRQQTVMPMPEGGCWESVELLELQLPYLSHEETA